ncbi:MAG: sodium:proton antiporter [Cytophagales bacterium]|nr:sodium:proton antiporter [Cytophagales bacterium]
MSHALSSVWAIPFAGMLLSIAFLPMLAPHVWHKHYGKVTAFWALAFLVPFGVLFGASAALGEFFHALLGEYIPFVLLLGALYTVSGGIYIRGNLHGSPALNTAILALGAVLASLMGTTGASMLLIRPLLRANDNRQHKAHVVIFFIFIVANVGGSLTPLGDPPLFLGFLQGVDFFWTLQHLWPETLFLVGALLCIFYALDYWFYHHREEVFPLDPTPDDKRIRFDGAMNFWLLLAILILVLLSGMWRPGIVFPVLGMEIGLQSVIRDVGLLVVAILSFKITPASVHADNQFSWEPMVEVAKLFAGIFLTILPVIAMLKEGAAGPFGAVVAAVTHPDGSPHPAAYFWITGLLSSFLDNAPTYLVFFNTAGGDPKALMTSLAPTLTAISGGAVFMGAMTYIGNAPNLMVRSIAQNRGVNMPSFFGYMRWSVCVLIPLFVLVTWIWL